MTTTPTPDITTARHATLADLTDAPPAATAPAVRRRRSATAIRSRDGVLLINGAGEPVIDDTG